MKKQSKSSVSGLAADHKVIIDSMVQKLTTGGGDGRISIADYQQIHQTIKDQEIPYHQAYQHLIKTHEDKFTTKALETAIVDKGLSHIGKGFDYLKMDSYDLTLNGQEKAYHVLKVTPGASYIKSTSEDTGNQHSTTTTSVIGYSQAHEEHVKAEVSGGSAVVQGSASVEFNEKYNSKSSASEFYSYVRNFYYDTEYTLNLESSKIEVSDALKEVVDKLPVIEGNLSDASHENQAAYTAIIDQFGTHFSHIIMVGGKFFMNKQISSQNYFSMESDGINVSAGAEGAFLGASFSAKASKDKKDTKAYESHVAVSSEDITYVGGNVAPVSPETRKAWNESISKFPGLVGVQLKEISEVFTNKYFPNDSSITSKRQALHQALGHYYQSKGLILDKDFNALAPIRTWVASNDTPSEFTYVKTVGDDKQKALDIAKVGFPSVTSVGQLWDKHIGYAYPETSPQPKGSTKLTISQSSFNLNQGKDQTVIGYTKGVIPLYYILDSNAAKAFTKYGYKSYTIHPEKYFSQENPMSFIGHVVAHVHADNPLIDQEDFYYPKTAIRYGDKIALRQKNPTYKNLAPFVTGAGTDHTSASAFYIESGETWAITNQNNPADRGPVKYGDTIHLQSHYGNKYLGIPNSSPSSKQAVINTASVPNSNNGLYILESRKPVGTPVNYLYDGLELVIQNHYLIGDNGTAYVVDPKDLRDYKDAQEWVILPVK